MSSVVRSAPLLLAVAALVACAPAPVATACLTRADCAASEICVGGRCVADTTRDAGPGHDAGGSDDASAMDDDAFVTPGDDAGMDDASSAIDDASTDYDAGPPDAWVPPHGDSCDDPIVLTLDGEGHAHAEGDFRDFASNHTTWCSEEDAHDVVYEIDVGPGPHDIEAVSFGDMMTDTTMAMSESCRPDEFYSCHDDRAPGDFRPRMIFHRYRGDHIWLLVRGFAATDLGHFTFDVDVRAVADTSTCATAIDITGGAYVAAWDGTTDAAPRPSCVMGGAIHSDVYSVSRGTEMTVDHVDAYFGDTQGVIALDDTCMPGFTESWCTPSGWVDGSYFGLGASSLPFQATATGYVVVAQPAAGESYTISFSP